MKRKASLNLLNYIQSMILVALVTLVGLATRTVLERTGIVMLYLLAVVVTAVFWGMGQSIMVSVLSVMVLDFFFVKPVLGFIPIDIRDIATLLVMLVVGTEISYLTSRVRNQTEEVKRHERETYNLYVLSRSLASTDDIKTSATAIVESAKQTLGYEAVLFLSDTQNLTVLKPYGENQHAFDENGVAIATWSFLNRQKAGQGTSVFPHAKAQYVPLMTAGGVAGVMAFIRFDLPEELNVGQKRLPAEFPDATAEYMPHIAASGTAGIPTPGGTEPTGLDTERERLLVAFLDLIAVAVERIALAQKTRNMEMFQEATEKLQRALLDSISHDLRTPLSSITGVLTSLQEAPGLNDAVKQDLLQIASGEAERLNNAITNLLDMSRIQAGGLSVSRQPSEVAELVSAALEQVGSRAEGRDVKVDIPTDLPLVNVDFALIVKVLDNLIDNAIKYSPEGSPLEISARRHDRVIEIAVSDHGVGIPPQELPRIFERFHRILRTGVTGIGLGLSICKGIVEAHAGNIFVENRQGGGTVVRFTLPFAEPDTHKEEKSND